MLSIVKLFCILVCFVGKLNETYVKDMLILLSFYVDGQYKVALVFSTFKLFGVFESCTCIMLYVCYFCFNCMNIEVYCEHENAITANICVSMIKFLPSSKKKNSSFNRLMTVNVHTHTQK